MGSNGVRQAGGAASDRSISQPALDKLLDEYRIAQRELLAEQQELGVDWRISDLVTLGSPLAHACFLLADNQLDWDDLLRERVYPTSLPQPEDQRDDERLIKHFAFADNTKHFKLLILHHAAFPSSVTTFSHARSRNGCRIAVPRVNQRPKRCRSDHQNRRESLRNVRRLS